MLRHWAGDVSQFHVRVSTDQILNALIRLQSGLKHPGSCNPLRSSRALLTCHRYKEITLAAVVLVDRNLIVATILQRKCSEGDTPEIAVPDRSIEPNVNRLFGAIDHLPPCDAIASIIEMDMRRTVTVGVQADRAKVRSPHEEAVA